MAGQARAARSRMGSNPRARPSTTGFQRAHRLVCRQRRPGGRAQMAVPRHLCRRVPVLVVLFLRLPTGFIPSEDQGNALGPVPASRRRDVRPHPAGRAGGRELFPAKGPKRRTSTPSSRSPAAAAAFPARTRARPISTLPPFDERKGSENSAQAIVDRASGAFRGLRDAQVFALVPGGDPRPRPIGRLHDGAAEHQRHDAASSSPAARDRLLAAATPIPNSRRSGSASCPTSPA